MAKVNFRNLPDSIQTRYNYDPDRAAEWENEQREFAAQQQTNVLADVEFFARYRALAELHRSLAGDAFAWYGLSMGPDGKVTAYGYTRGARVSTITIIPSRIATNPVTADLSLRVNKVNRCASEIGQGPSVPSLSNRLTNRDAGLKTTRRE